MSEFSGTPVGADAIPLQTSRGPAWVVSSVESIAPELRRAAFRSRCKDFRYYEMQEASVPDQFQYRYFVLRDETTGSWALQPFFFVQQDLLAGLPSGARSLFDGARKLWPNFLKLPMMMIGCATGEGELDHDEPWLPQALHAAIEAYRPKAGALIILLKDFPSRYREPLKNFSSDGYQRAPSMPGAHLALDFPSFEEYMMQRLGKVFRKNLRRKLRASEEGAPITMEVMSDATPIARELHALYLQTHERSEFSFEKLTEEYLSQIGQRMPERVRFFIWRQNGRIVAFNLSMVHGDTLHDLNLGMDYSVALDLALYFVTWRDMVEWSLQNGIKAYSTGPLNYDPKSHLRLLLAPLDLYSRFNWSLINPIFKLALKYLEPTRHDKTLQRFPNSNELL